MMKFFTYKQAMFYVLAFVSILFVGSCKKNEDNKAATKTIKVGLVSAGGFGDLSYNDLALSGLNRAAADLQVTSTPYEGVDPAAIQKGINYFVQENYDLIICMSYLAKSPAYQAALANPSIHFLLIDDTVSNAPSNMKCFLYQIDQATFLSGFIAAYWADKSDPLNPQAAWIGGIQIPVIEQFKVGYLSGIKHFNDVYKRNVATAGNYVGSFEDTLAGSNLAAALIANGADVIFPFAGRSGLGVLKTTKAQSKWAIGVDGDQYYSVPQVSDILLTSCIKKIDLTIYNEIKQYAQQGWIPASFALQGLSTGEVGYAPFHDYAPQIADSIKTRLNNIKNGLIDGSIKTGW